MKLLQVAAEIFPLVKTGGLADVMGALPQALLGQGHDTRLVLPGLPAIVDAVLHQQPICRLGAIFGAGRVELRLGRMPYSHLPVYVIDAPFLYRRPGSPYQQSDGSEWPDNAQRFGLLGWVAAHLAAGELDPRWTPDILHAHDWHAAMSCAYVVANPAIDVGTVFTVHNLAFQGLFPAGDFHLLGLPARLMHATGLEFHHQLSFMKAGLKFADHVTTVSPTYAAEIATPDQGFGLHGVIQGRVGTVSGILNGVDGKIWNPATDPALARRYDASDLSGKLVCKQTLQREMGLAESADSLLIAVVSRLSSQKGLDLLLDALPSMLGRGVQLVLQGTGEPSLESAFRSVAAANPRQVAVRIGYDEQWAHAMMGAADAVMVPSRFEPCGLTQLYGLRYGSLPIVRRVGGLADTVLDLGDGSSEDGRSTGFSFEHATPAALDDAVFRAQLMFAQPGDWTRMMQRAMAQDFSWQEAAASYGTLYRQVVERRQARERVHR